MVQSDVAQLSDECTEWRTHLRNFREELNQCKLRLPETISLNSVKEDLTQVAYFSNQFHIQLINIHDLKQAIKHHERKIKFEMETHNGHVALETLAEHDHLLGEYLQLSDILVALRQKFTEFLHKT